MKRHRTIGDDGFGNPVTDYSDRLGTVLLAFVGGFIGCHKFYLRKIGTGMIYVLFFWTFIPLIISIFEGFRYLFMTNEEFDKIYNPRYCK